LKRYELAKREGLPWQAVLVTDAETDLKLLIRDCVVSGDSISTVNEKVTKFTKDILDRLESEEIKAKVKQSFPVFANRLYYKWITVYGTRDIAVAYLVALKSQNSPIPKAVEEMLNAIPKTRDLSVFDPSLNAETYNRATPNNTYNLEYEKEIKRRINEIADMSAKVDYNTRYSLRANVELDLRWEYNQKQINGLKENGVELAWIDSHANCSERCAPHQAKLYSLTGKTGTIDGIAYAPLETATEIYDKYGYRNGCLSGFNCRHKLVAYKKGFRPQEIPEEVMLKQRELEKQQRYMERTVRLYESRALMYKGNGQQKLYRNYKNLAKEWTERYESFSRKNRVPFYPSRLDV
jgi:hypothetical protein